MPPAAWLLAALLTLAALPRTTLATQTRTCSSGSDRPHPRGVCGTQLAALTANLCTAMGGSSTLRMLVKRGMDEEPYVGAVNERMRGIMLNKEEAFSYLSKREAGGSMACECCYNSCRFLELAAYCQFSPTMFSRRSRRGRHQNHNGRSQSRRSHSGRRANSNHNVEDAFS